MKSYEEMAQNVFRRGEEYFRKKEKRNNTIKKGASFMSLFSIITLAGLGLWSSNIQSPVIPENPSEIVIVETGLTSDITTAASESSRTSTVTGTAFSVNHDTTTASGSAEAITATAVSENFSVSVHDGTTTEITAVTTASNIATASKTTTTTAPPVAEPSPVVTDPDKTIYNVVSVGDDFITMEIGEGSEYDYMTFYNHTANYYYVYKWSYENTDIYAVTAESGVDPENIIIPDGAEIISDTKPYLYRSYDGWEYMESQTGLAEISDPYILVKGASPEELYSLNGVKDVYKVDKYHVHSSDIYRTDMISILTSEIDRTLTIEDFAEIDGVTAVIKESNLYRTEQMRYTIEIDNSAETIETIFNICKSLIELDTVDCTFPMTMSTLEGIPFVYTVDLVQNTYTENEVDIYEKYTFEEFTALSEEEICAISDEAAEAYRFYGDNSSGAEEEFLLHVLIDESYKDSDMAELFMYPADMIDGGYNNEAYISNDDKVYAECIFNFETYLVNSDRFHDEHLRSAITAWFYLNPLTKLCNIEIPSGTDMPEESLNICEKYTFEEFTALSEEEICAISDEAAEAYRYGTENYGLSESLLLWADKSAGHESFMLPDGIVCSIEGNGHFSDSDIVYNVHAFELNLWKYSGYDEVHLQGAMAAWLITNPATVYYEFELPNGSDTDSIIGDVNGNGTVDISDAAEALSIYARSAAGISIEEYTEQQRINADVNGDGAVDISDASAILAYYAQNAAGMNPSWDDII